ncbi:MAG TPA: DUF3426 domain-containing protein [Gammaproteobacteria bacterium]|nr:DUF3426 domain-containing protein [Gammaproteobacteria bacterium]
MYVACPSCKALYKIELVHLRAAGGQLHCGACKTRFNASAAVFEDPQQALAYEYPPQVEEAEAQAIDELVHRALDQVPGPQEEEPGSVAGEKDLVDDILSAQGDELHRERVSMRADVDFNAWPPVTEFPAIMAETPSAEADEFHQAYLLQHAVEGGGRASWGMIAVALLLILLLVAQYIWGDRYHLAQFAQWRPALEIFCKPLDCNLPLRRDLGQIEITEREIVRHPYIADALLVNATFVNNADFTQAYPLFQISFSDVSGAPVAARRFLPAEYLAAPGATDEGMAPGEQVHAVLEIIDPGERAVSFQFDFL